MRVVLVCHYFMSPAIEDRVKWSWRGKMKDVAIWNRILVEELGQRDDIELHVITGMYHMRYPVQTFSIDKTRYYLYKPDVPFFNTSWRRLGKLDVRTNYWWARHCVQRWIRKINPDIVNLIGAENPYYSASILGLVGFPIFISMQSVYSNPDRFKVEAEDGDRSYFERKVIAENRYFGVNAPFMPRLIKRDVANPILMWNRFPTPGGGNRKPDCAMQREYEQGNSKEYDFVQFSALTELKGAPDTIKATAIVKKEFPSVRVRMMGGIGGEFKDKMKRLIADLGLEKNVVLTDGYKLHSELMSEAAKGKYYILPTKVDTIPTTIFEATHLGMPVVCYKTGDIPKLNTQEERVLLAERFDVDGLAAQMLRLLRNPSLGEVLNRKTRQFVDKYFSNEANIKQHVAILHAVIDNYKNGTPIPEDLLYDGYLERKLRL